MNQIARVRFALRWPVRLAAAAAAAYGGYVALAWLRYGNPSPAAEADALLDRFMPVYDIVERHHTRVRAPAATTFAAACDTDLTDSRLVRAIFKGRELILRGAPDAVVRPRGIVALTTSIGWGVLAEAARHEIVLGAVTRPWEANVVFHPLPPDEFVRFREPDYVKIAWTLRADPDGESASVFRTETRAVATDDEARWKFRRYWSFLSPGIIVIRWTMLGPVRAEAERRARMSEQDSADAR